MSEVDLMFHPYTLHRDIGSFWIGVLRISFQGADVGERSRQSIWILELPSTFLLQKTLPRGWRDVFGRLRPGFAVGEEAAEGCDT